MQIDLTRLFIEAANPHSLAKACFPVVSDFTCRKLMFGGTALTNN
jgi:hypothetical protein